MTPEELNWVAGLFEGEGTIHHTRLSKTWTVSLASTDEDVVHKFLSAVKFGAIYAHEPRDENRKSYWLWAAGKQKEVKEFLLQMSPLLCTRRRAKAEEAIKYITENPKTHKPNAPIKKGLSYEALIQKNRQVSLV